MSNSKFHKTLIIPFVPFDPDALSITITCLKSFVPYFDRIITVRNGWIGLDCSEIKQLSDVMIELPFNLQMAGAINLGYLEAIKYSDTEFLFFANNDTQNNNMDLDMLCRKGSVCSPKIGEQSSTLNAHASFFAIHKDDFKKMGWWALECGGAADEDWLRRSDEAGITREQIIDCTILHNHPAFTNSKLGEFKHFIRTIYE